MYARFFKRLLDFVISLCAIVVLSPLFLALIIIGFISMKGNPFFVQERPGYHEKIFKLLKFRSMNMNRDASGALLPDIQRITGYGRFLRNSSLDELPELFNILVGDMAIVGPRPLLVKYLPLYSEEQRHRHDVRPGLTGLAQVHGRNCLTWEDRFKLDVQYARNITFRGDLKIIIDTALAVLRHEGINSEATSKYTVAEFTGKKGE